MDPTCTQGREIGTLTHTLQAAETPAEAEQAAEVTPEDGELWYDDILALNEHSVAPGPQGATVHLNPAVQATLQAQMATNEYQVELEAMLQELEQASPLHEETPVTQNEWTRDIQGGNYHSDDCNGYSHSAALPHLLVMFDTPSSDTTGVLEAPAPMKGFIADPGPCQNPNLPPRDPPLQFQPCASESRPSELRCDGDFKAPVLCQHTCPGPINLGDCLQWQQHRRRFNTQEDPTCTQELDDSLLDPDDVYYALQAAEAPAGPAIEGTEETGEPWQEEMLVFAESQATPVSQPSLEELQMELDALKLDMRRDELQVIQAEWEQDIQDGDYFYSPTVIPPQLLVMNETPNRNPASATETPTEESCTLENTTQPCTANKKDLQHLHGWTTTQLQEIADSREVSDDRYCVVCGSPQDGERLMLCDGCGEGFHPYCMGLGATPGKNWLCNLCAPIPPQPRAAALAAGNSNLGNPPCTSPPSPTTSSFQLVGLMPLPDLRQSAARGAQEEEESDIHMTAATPLLEIWEDKATLDYIQESAYAVTLLPDEEEKQKKAVKRAIKRADTSYRHPPSSKAYAFQRATRRCWLDGKDKEDSGTPTETVPPDKNDKEPSQEAAPMATAPPAASGLDPWTEHLALEWAAKQDSIATHPQDDVWRGHQSQNKDKMKRHLPLDVEASTPVGTQVLLHNAPKSKMAKHWSRASPYELVNYGKNGTQYDIGETKGKPWKAANDWQTPYSDAAAAAPPTDNTIVL
jgi:hypothetical protein